MNGLVKDTLGLSSMHGIQSSTVFDELREDFMKPVINQGIGKARGNILIRVRC